MILFALIRWLSKKLKARQADRGTVMEKDGAGRAPS